MKNLIIIGMLLFAFATVQAQEKKMSRKEKRAAREAKLVEDTKTALENKVFVFEATQMLPSGGRSKSLTSEYDVQIKNDTVVCYLPYFGRAHMASYGSSESPMDFTQPIEDYEFEKTKKGYEIKFNVKNNSDRLNFIFQIADNGSSTLSVTSSNRSTISYTGNIKKPKEKEEKE
jgi:hypothetical protein